MKLELFFISFRMNPFVQDKSFSIVKYIVFKIIQIPTRVKQFTRSPVTIENTSPFGEAFSIAGVGFLRLGRNRG